MDTRESFKKSSSNDDNYRGICLISPLFHDAFSVPLNNLIKIILTLSQQNKVIIGKLDSVQWYFNEYPNSLEFINYSKEKEVFFRVLNYFSLSMNLIKSMFKYTKDVKIYLFFCESGLLFPMIFGKITGKKVIWLLPSNFQSMMMYQNDLITRVLKIPHIICLTLVHQILLYSPNLIHQWKLDQYRDKILITHEHFIDFTTFTVTTPLPERPPLIGYVGRLSKEKGPHLFVQAFPSIFNERPDLRILLVGDGNLREDILRSLENDTITNCVDFQGWISHEDLPKKLNNLQLLVIPSYIEGLPNIMLEAMACGTPVLATPVGAIPDVIRDGETGFIMETNLPECIATNVIRALIYPDLEIVAQNGRRLIEEKFSIEKAVERWREILMQWN